MMVPEKEKAPKKKGASVSRSAPIRKREQSLRGLALRELEAL
jgi:hypothetical protein